LRAERQHGGDDGGKTGRDRRDREADADQEEIVEGLTPDQAEKDHEDQRDRRHRRDHDGQLVELAGQRGLLLLDLAEHPRDLADLGRHPCCRDDHLAAPACHGRVHVGHVRPVAERDLVARHRIDRLQDGHALPGEGGLLDLERRGHEQSPVRGNLVARLERDDVSRHELLGGDVHQVPVSPSVRPDHEHLLQRGDALCRLALLVEAEDGVEDGEPEDHDPGAEVLQRGDADDRGADEDKLHQVAVLAQERVPCRLLRGLRQLVRPHLTAPPLDLGRGEPLQRVDAEPLAHLLGGQPVPGDNLPAGALGRRERRHLE